MIAALAGIRLDRARIERVADPAATGHGHRLQAVGAFGKLDVSIENRPLADNPRSSELTALALVRILENRRSSLAFGVPHKTPRPPRFSL